MAEPDLQPLGLFCSMACLFRSFLCFIHTVHSMLSLFSKIGWHYKKPFQTTKTSNWTICRRKGRDGEKLASRVRLMQSVNTTGLEFRPLFLLIDVPTDLHGLRLSKFRKNLQKVLDPCFAEHALLASNPRHGYCQSYLQVSKPRPEIYLRPQSLERKGIARIWSQMSWAQPTYNFWKLGKSLWVFNVFIPQPDLGWITPWRLLITYFS